MENNEYKSKFLAFKDRKVFVTGASGFVGSHLVHRLVDAGAKVNVLVRKTSDPKKVKQMCDIGINVHFGDVTDEDSLLEPMKGCKYVFHIAALFREAKHGDDYYYKVNRDGTKNVLDAAMKCGVDRVVHCSTVGVHSHIPNPPADENEEYRPGDIYQKSKCEGEKLALERFKNRSPEGVVVRPAMIWGEGDLRMLKLYKGVANRKFPVIGDGKTLTHWVHVDDLVDGFMLAMVTPEAAGEVYIIAGRDNITIEDLVSEVAKVAGVKPLPFKIPAYPVQLLGTIVEKICIPLNVEPPIYRRRVDFFTKDRSFNITKAKTQLGYTPKLSTAEEIEKIYTWYKTEGLL